MMEIISFLELLVFLIETLKNYPQVQHNFAVRMWHVKCSFNKILMYPLEKLRHLKFLLTQSKYCIYYILQNLKGFCSYEAS